MELAYEPGIGIFLNIRRTSLLFGYRLVEVGPFVLPCPSVLVGRKVN